MGHNRQMSEYIKIIFRGDERHCGTDLIKEHLCTQNELKLTDSLDMVCWFSIFCFTFQ